MDNAKPNVIPFFTYNTPATISISLTNERIIVHEVVQLLGADQERTDDTTPMERFLVVGDATFAHQVDHTAGKHL